MFTDYSYWPSPWPPLECVNASIQLTRADHRKQRYTKLILNLLTKCTKEQFLNLNTCCKVSVKPAEMNLPGRKVA